MIITFAGCKGQKDSFVTNIDPISRYGQIADNDIQNLLEQLTVYWVENPVLGSVAYELGGKIHTASRDLQTLIEANSIEKDNFEASLNAFSEDIFDLGLERKFSSKVTDQHIRYWIENKINISKSSNLIIYDIKLAELEVLREIIRSINSTSYTFNYLKPIVVDSTDIIRAGDTYIARIYIAAFDTTRYPSIKINGEYIEVQNEGFGIFRFKSNKPGIKTFDGELVIQRNDHELDTFRFKKSISIY